MARKTTRRDFVKTASAAGLGFWVAGGIAPKQSRAANEQIQFACIGISGKGGSDSRHAAMNGKVVGICDTNSSLFEPAQKTRAFKDAKAYTDFRKMLEELGDKIDAVTVSTPDHTHAPAALMAMRMGKHCFCQKPLTRTIYEARLMAEVAEEMEVQTVMGNQGSACDGFRRAAAMVQAGVLGEPKEVHVWSNRPIWPQGYLIPELGERPKDLDWDCWLGPAEMRPYATNYQPFKWRGWWDFGSGALGDMACHTVNMPFAACDLFDPTSVQATTSGHNGMSYPKWSIINFEFPAIDGKRGPIKFTWSDGGKKAAPELLEGFKDENGNAFELSGSGAIIIGSKGKMYSPADYGEKFYLAGVDPIEVEYRPGTEGNPDPVNFKEWIDAINGGKPALSNFVDHAGRLTETILLGNLAVWTAAGPKEQPDDPDFSVEGPKVEWDAKALKCTNMPELNDTIVKPAYREGWTLDA